LVIIKKLQDGERMLDSRMRIMFIACSNLTLFYPL
jgi:hypothetical protein